jgi:CRP-like cAMP-binding protein
MSLQINNLFLSGLSLDARAELISHSIEVNLPQHTVLYESGRVPRNAYFLTFGLASVVTPMSNGEAAEVGFIGNEGVVSSLQLLGRALISTRCMMQLAGGGLKIPFSILQGIFETSEETRKRVLEFVQQQAFVVGQIAGCNRLHGAEQRLIRWLLMAQDRTQSDVLKFTQEYLAEMIGARRTTVTVLACHLQERSLIRYNRGTIHLLDRGRLEAITCDCYRIIQRLYENLYHRDAVAVSINGYGYHSLAESEISRA